MEGVGESACSQAQEGGGPTHQTMPVLKGQNGRELEGMTQRMRHHVDGEGAGEGWGKSSSLDPVFLKRTGERSCTLLPRAGHCLSF